MAHHLATRVQLWPLLRLQVASITPPKSRGLLCPAYFTGQAAKAAPSASSAHATNEMDAKRKKMTVVVAGVILCCGLITRSPNFLKQLLAACSLFSCLRALFLTPFQPYINPRLQCQACK